MNYFLSKPIRAFKGYVVRVGKRLLFYKQGLIIFARVASVKVVRPPSITLSVIVIVHSISYQLVPSFRF